jgi:hypothetical protein
MPPRFELRAGAEITFGGAPDGRIIDVDPPELFAFSWGTDHLRREIRPDGAGSVLVLHHVRRPSRRRQLRQRLVRVRRGPRPAAGR